MIGIRIGGEEIWLEPEEWVRWLEDGRISPEAVVKLENTPWVPAGTLPDFRRLARDDRLPPPGKSLREVVFPRRGLSATEGLLLANLFAAAALTVHLGPGYLPEIRRWTTAWWHQVNAGHSYGWWLLTIFLHAGVGHLARNMVALLATAAAVEYLAGAWWTVGLYLVTGVAGMVVSYLGHSGPPLSIGASGAIYGLGGSAIAMIIRHRSKFTERQRWKAWRIYVPLFLALALPSLLHADYWGHAGGLASGLLLGPWIPRRR